MKICKSCGAELDNAASFCTKCGAIVTDEPKTEEVTIEKPVVEESSASETATYYSEAKPAAEQVTLEMPVEDSDSTKKLKKLLFIAAGAIAVVLVIALLYNALIGSAYKKPIDKFLKAVNGQSADIEELLEIAYPDLYVSAYKNLLEYKKAYDDATDKETYEKYVDNFEEKLLETYDELEDDYGKGVKVTYKITDKEEVSKGTMRSFKDAMEVYEDLLDDDIIKAAVERIENNLVENFDMKKKDAKEVAEKYEKLLKDLKKACKNFDVTEGYELTVEYEIKGKEDNDDDEITLYMLKINGKWCLMNPEEFDDLSDIVSLMDGVLSSVTSNLY